MLSQVEFGLFTYVSKSVGQLQIFFYRDKILTEPWNHLGDIFGIHSICLEVNCLLVYQSELSLISVSYICRHLFYFSNFCSHGLSCSIYYSRWTQPLAPCMMQMQQVRHGLFIEVSIWLYQYAFLNFIIG